MRLDRSARRHIGLRPRAGLAATALLVAGLAGSGAVALLADFVEPARAQSAASRIDQPTPATLPNGATRANGDVAAPHALKPSTDVMDTGTVSDARTNPMQHLPDRTRATH